MTKKIIMGVTDLSFHRTTASLVANVLKAMGFEVERILSPHQENFEKLKIGQVDMLSSAWLPSSHGIYKAGVEEVEHLSSLGFIMNLMLCGAYQTMCLKRRFLKS